MRKQAFWTILLAMLGGIFLAACGGGGDTAAPEAAGGVQESIDVIMQDIFFGDTNENAANPPTWTVSSGAQVTVNMENTGVLEHTWAIVEAGAELPAAIGDPAEVEDLLLVASNSVLGADSDALTFTAPEAGEYQVICTIAGHYPLMQGTLIVE